MLATIDRQFCCLDRKAISPVKALGQPNYQLLVLLALACRRQCVAEVSINLTIALNIYFSFTVKLIYLSIISDLLEAAFRDRDLGNG